MSGLKHVLRFFRCPQNLGRSSYEDLLLARRSLLSLHGERDSTAHAIVQELSDFGHLRLPPFVDFPLFFGILRSPIKRSAALLNAQGSLVMRLSSSQVITALRIIECMPLSRRHALRPLFTSLCDRLPDAFEGEDLSYVGTAIRISATLGYTKMATFHAAQQKIVRAIQQGETVSLSVLTMSIEGFHKATFLPTEEVLWNHIEYLPVKYAASKSHLQTPLRRSV